MKVRALILAIVFASAIPLAAQAPSGSVTPPAGARLLLQAKGEGFQIYSCTQTQTGWQWTLKAPDAKLVDPSGKVIGKHFAGPTWQLTDGGSVQGELMASQPSPAPQSVAWLLLRARPGTAKGSFGEVQFIRRSETQGGAAPASGCKDAEDAGKASRIPYTASYSFYASK